MKYMVDVTFLEGHQSEIQSLMGQERTHVQGLMQSGIVEQVFISQDHQEVWLVMQGESEEQIKQEVQRFPLAAFFQARVIGLA